MTTGRGAKIMTTKIRERVRVMEDTAKDTGMMGKTTAKAEMAMERVETMERAGETTTEKAMGRGAMGGSFLEAYEVGCAWCLYLTYLLLWLGIAIILY
jgi:hypothetical protein